MPPFLPPNAAALRGGLSLLEDYSHLADPQVWIHGAVQIFFSLGLLAVEPSPSYTWGQKAVSYKVFSGVSKVSKVVIFVFFFFFFRFPGLLNFW